MKIRIASDFHFEFYNYKTQIDTVSNRDINECIVLPVMENENEQLLVLAGDILNAKHTEKFYIAIDNLSKRFKKIFVIAGNHEHYNNDYNASLHNLNSFYNNWDNIIFMENKVHIHDDIAFFGATLWTNMNNNDVISKLNARVGMNDFRIIRKKGKLFTPDDSIIEHHATMVNLDQFFIDYDKYKKVIITHHAPSFNSVAEMYKTEKSLNAAFYSDYDSYIMENQPDLWIHGHMHNTSDYMIGGSRIICNPYGYFHETEDYNGKMVVDI